MLGFPSKKPRQVDKRFLEYVEVFREIRERFGNAMPAAIKAAADQDFFTFSPAQTHQFESQADDTVDPVTGLICGKRSLPTRARRPVRPGVVDAYQVAP